MTHEEAIALKTKLAAEEPDKVFELREAQDGSWEVVSMTLPIERTPPVRQAETRAGPDVRPDPTETQHPPVHGTRGY